MVCLVGYRFCKLPKLLNFLRKRKSTNKMFSTLYNAVMSPWQPKQSDNEFYVHEDEETPEKPEAMKQMDFDDEDDSDTENSGDTNSDSESVAKPSPKQSPKKHDSKKRGRGESDSTSPVLSDNSRSKRSRTAAKKPAAKKPAAKKTRAKTPCKVKMEPSRRSSRRSTRTQQKKGFYSQNRLEKTAWDGNGTVKDPVCVW